MKDLKLLKIFIFVKFNNIFIKTDIIIIYYVRDDLKKKSKLRDIGGVRKKSVFSLITKRENYLRGGGVKSKSPYFTWELYR